MYSGKWIIVTLFCACTVIFTNVQGSNTFSINKKSFKYAETACVAKNGTLVDPGRTENYWLPIKKNMYSQWQWTDGRKYDRNIVHPGTEVAGQECAIMRTRDSILDEVSCFQPTFGYICQTNNSLVCSKATCILLNDKILVINYTRVSWYKAVDLCHEKNMQIATFNHKTLQNTLDELYKNWNVDDHFWIGLTKSEWKKQENRRNLSCIDLERNHWLQVDEMPLGHCAISTSDGKWKVADCNAEYLALCQINSNEDPKSPRNDSDTTTQHAQANKITHVTVDPKVLNHLLQKTEVQTDLTVSPMPEEYHKYNILMPSKHVKFSIITVALLAYCVILTTFICFCVVIKNHLNNFCSDNKNEDCENCLHVPPECTSIEIDLLQENTSKEAKKHELMEMVNQEESSDETHETDPFLLKQEDVDETDQHDQDNLQSFQDLKKGSTRKKSKGVQKKEKSAMKKRKKAYTEPCPYCNKYPVKSKDFRSKLKNKNNRKCRINQPSKETYNAK